MLVRVPGCHEGGECSGVALIDERLRFLDRVYLVPLIGVLGLAYAYGVGGEWEEEGRGGEREIYINGVTSMARGTNRIFSHPSAATCRLARPQCRTR